MTAEQPAAEQPAAEQPTTSAPTTPEPTTPEPTTERSPVDVLRLAVATVALVGMALVDLFLGDAVAAFFAELLTGLRAIPDWLASLVVFGARVGIVVLGGAGLVATVAGRRVRLALTVAGAVALGLLLFVPFHLTLEEAAGGALDTYELPGPLGDEEFPTTFGLVGAAAAATAAAPWLTRSWRRAVWSVLTAAALSRFLTAPASLDTVSALAMGWFSGSAVLAAVGGPVRRPPPEAVADGLEGVGVALAHLERASVDARGSTPYFGADRDGRRLFVKVLGADERSADLMFRTYRRILPHDLGDEKAFSSLRRTVEHEALVSYAARDLGVRTPQVVAFATVEPEAYVLAYEAIDGSSLDRVDADDFSDELLGEVWAQVARLRHHRIAHRDLRLANLFRSADGAVLLIDFGFSELAASDLLLANDLAELLASTTVVVGPRRAVAAASAVLGPTELATAVDRLRPFAFSGATRTALKERAGLLDELRAEVERAVSAGSVPPS